MAQRKLLLADDSITIQKVVNLTFADEGIEVITVGDGDSAMEKLTEVAPDLVMADVNMPGLNGYQICERIRQSETLKKTPVILLVGSFEPFDEAEARRVGADDFLTKPFQSIRQLVNKVTDLLRNAPQNGEGAAAPVEFESAGTVTSFEDTQEYVSPDFSPAQPTPQYGDAGMDDEMIQTNNVSGFALDESSKFETREVNEAEDVGKTQPLSAEDLRQFSFTHLHQDAPAGEETADETSAAENLNEQITPQSEIETEEFAAASAAPQTESVLEADDGDDILEIPFEEEDWEEEETPLETAAQPEPQAYTPAEDVVESAPIQSETAEPLSSPEQGVSEQSASAETPAQVESLPAATADQGSSGEVSAAAASAQLSPEMINAIAQKVVEMLSDRAVKDVAWEVVPEMADLIIKKMAEEKLKE